MPCDDISERILVELDPDDRVLTYSLTKETCGAEVGSPSLLHMLVTGKNVEEILGLDSFAMADSWQSLPLRQEFLYFKHLFALQETLRVYIGERPGNKAERIALASVSHDPAGVQLSGIVDIEAITRDIRACGNCRSCSTTLPSSGQRV